MDEYYRILESLPPALRTPLAKLDAHYAPHIQEIRLRLGQPVQFTICGRLCPAAKFLPGTDLPAALETDTLRDCFLQLCRRSVYAYEDELKQGSMMMARSAFSCALRASPRYMNTVMKGA